MAARNILILGASYGSLLASKIMFAGHNVSLVCLPAEANLINAEGFRVRMPIRGREGLVEIDSRKLRGKVNAGQPGDFDPKNFDLIGLAMQEPQYRSPGVRELLDSVAKSKVPCMSIMNMPPLPFIKRIPGLDYAALTAAYTYRCVTKDGMRTAQEAVHTDIEESRSVYNFVNDLCVKLGAAPGDLVPFDKYAAAAQSLSRPASVARALNNGAPNVERADKLVQLIARQKGLAHPVIDAGVALVDARLESNRKKAAA
jgi:hypothetical protein